VDRAPELPVVFLAIVDGSALYQASGSALMTRSGVSGWAKKNQCHHFAANRASQRPSASLIGTLSRSASWATRLGWSRASRSAT